MTRQNTVSAACLLLILTPLFALNGCVSVSQYKPIYVAEEEIGCLTRETKIEILTHNETWKKDNQ